MIIECPSCQSKFNLDDGQLARDRVKLRCRICSQVFVYEKSSLSNLEQEFESLLTESESAALLKDQPETPAADQEPADPAPETSESVTEELEALLPQADQPKPKKRARRILIAVLILLLLGGLTAAGGYYYYYYSGHSATRANAAPVKLPITKPASYFMTITQGSLTYDLLPRENGETVLVIQGTVKRLSDRAVNSLLLEAKLSDEKSRLLETKQFYAGIVPQKDEFIAQSAATIDELLMAAPAADSAAITRKEIPFALAFFGDSARKAATVQIEVKEIQWQPPQ